jgi:hypothetical protein
VQLGFGPYDNGPILVIQPGYLLGMSTVDLTTVYRVEL